MTSPAVGEGRPSTGKQKPSAEVKDLGPLLGREGAIRGTILRECLLCLCAIEEYMGSLLQAESGGKGRVLLCLETWVCDKEEAGEGARDVGREEGQAQGASAIPAITGTYSVEEGAEN